MANPEHFTKLINDVKEWNRWRNENYGVDIDLSGADLACADLNGADLRRANLIGADLRAAYLETAQLGAARLVGANLAEAKLGGANLHGADLSKAKLIKTDLFRADLGMTNLAEAHLVGADLVLATLHQAKLQGAYVHSMKVGSTIFAAIDLSEVRGLERCNHKGPSTVGIDTVFQSRGKIPDSFLRSCGVPEQFITYARSLAGQPIEFYSCVIGYSNP